jgi:hypothetical protein
VPAIVSTLESVSDLFVGGVDEHLAVEKHQCRKPLPALAHPLEEFSTLLGAGIAERVGCPVALQTVPGLIRSRRPPFANDANHRMHLPTVRSRPLLQKVRYDLVEPLAGGRPGFVSK